MAFIERPTRRDWLILAIAFLLCAIPITIGWGVAGFPMDLFQTHEEIDGTSVGRIG